MKKFSMFIFLACMMIFSSLFSQDTSEKMITEESLSLNDLSLDKEQFDSITETNLSYKYHLSKAKILLIELEEKIANAKKESNVELVSSLLAEKKLLESQIELLQVAIDASEKEKTESDFLKYIVWGFLGIFFIAVLVLFAYSMILRFRLKDSQKQQETFLQILEKASFIQESEDLEGEVIEKTEVVQDVDLKSIKTELAKLKKKQLDDSEFMDLKNLSIQCEVIGRKVDKTTGRKNNSKNVADLVFKLAHELACTSYEALIYYCAALIFDVGFLYINQKIFSKPEISTDEKKEIRSHVNRGKEELVFIPEKYRAIFEIAVSMHHENNDGSGYPNGLTKKDIPLLARLIRVAETYIALVTRRNYRGIFDRDSAFLELKKESEKYDKDVLAALYRVM